MDLEEYQNLMNYLLYHQYPAKFTNQQKQKLARQSVQFIVENNYLFRKNRKNFDKPLRVITLPDREKILYNLHSSPLGGHFGINKTIEKAKELYYWPTMQTDIRNYIESCDACQRIGKPQRIQLKDSIKIIKPFYQIGIDFIGPLDLTTNGNKYIIVATDYFTK